jgi:hypothetical protein
LISHLLGESFGLLSGQDGHADQVTVAVLSGDPWHNQTKGLFISILQSTENQNFS